MKITVVRFPGSNCDEDTRWALASLGAQVRLVWHLDGELGRTDAVVLPGGFSYGDYLRSGAMAARSPIMSAVASFAARGGPVLGICNGFQILTERGMLPGQLARNAGLRFLCRTVPVRVERALAPWTSGYSSGQVIRLPIAHNEGRYYAPAETVTQLEHEGQVLFRYCDSAGRIDDISNPNGSVDAIAGIVTRGGNVLGMMPHPERAVEPLLGSDDGRPLLVALLTAAADGTLRA